MIVADTSVWIDHLRRGSPGLVRRLEAGEVAMHPFVVGELACGTLRDRAGFLGQLQLLETVPRATDDEVLHYVERCDLFGRGLGWVDAHLLASVQLAGWARLWTLDRRLQEVADERGLGVRV